VGIWSEFLDSNLHINGENEVRKRKEPVGKVKGHERSEYKALEYVLINFFILLIVLKASYCESIG